MTTRNMQVWGFEKDVVFDPSNKEGWESKKQPQSILRERAIEFAEQVSCIPLAFGIREKAQKYATLLHFGQFRKYYNPPLPYIVHPIDVANRTASLAGATDELIAACYLHDVSEDCGVENDVIQKYFGNEVASFVDDLTNKFKDAKDSKGKLLPRAERKALEFVRIKTIRKESKWVKMVDRLDNLKDMDKVRAGDFVKVYSKESAKLLEVVQDSDETLASELRALITKLGGYE